MHHPPVFSQLRNDAAFTTGPILTTEPDELASIANRHLFTYIGKSGGMPAQSVAITMPSLTNLLRPSLFLRTANWAWGVVGSSSGSAWRPAPVVAVVERESAEIFHWGSVSVCGRGSGSSSLVSLPSPCEESSVESWKRLLLHYHSRAKNKALGLAGQAEILIGHLYNLIQS